MNEKAYGWVVNPEDGQDDLLEEELFHFPEGELE